MGKGPMDKVNGGGGGFKVEGGSGQAGESNGVKMGATILNNNKNFKDKKMKEVFLKNNSLLDNNL